MSKTPAKTSTVKNTANRNSAISSRQTNHQSDVVSVAISEAVTGLCTIISQITHDESTSEQSCRDTSDTIIKALLSQLERTDLTTEERGQAIKAIQAERDRIFSKDSEIRENNTARIKMFLSFALKIMFAIGGIVLLKEASQLLKDALISGNKT